MSAAEVLIRLVAPPEVGQVSVDWAQLEERLGVQLPADYKWLVGRYGGGKFDDFLHVLQPLTSFPPVQLEHAVLRSTEILKSHVASGEVLPHPVEALLPVATTDNGDTVYWVMRPEGKPQEWTIVVNPARSMKWTTFDGGIVEFLVAALVGEIQVEVFPKSFPSRSPRFDQYPEGPRRRGSR